MRAASYITNWPCRCGYADCLECGAVGIGPACCAGRGHRSAPIAAGCSGENLRWSMLEVCWLMYSKAQPM
jgi:hypothetical protein